MKKYRSPMCDRLGESLSDHPDNVLQLAPFALGQVVETLLHGLRAGFSAAAVEKKFVPQKSSK
jgi:hypothetical protein